MLAIGIGIPIVLKGGPSTLPGRPGRAPIAIAPTPRPPLAPERPEQPSACTCRPEAPDPGSPRVAKPRTPGTPPAPKPPADLRIAFASDRAGNFDIYTMSAQGTNVKRLTIDPADERDPAWSPDGKQIAFTRKKGLSEFTGEIFIMNADGSNQRRIVRGGAPKFSPDGKHIAYHALAGEETTDVPLSLWVISADGTNNRRITDQGGDPTWTPDGRHLVYGGITGPIVNVFKIPAIPGAKRERLYKDPIFACMPDVSLDGLQVAYVTAKIEGADLGQFATKLVVAKMGGPSGDRITESPDWEFAPSWSPDGTLIAVERDVDLDPHYATYAGGIAPGPGRSWLAIVRADGSGEFEIPNRSYSDADPAFAPGST